MYQVINCLLNKGLNASTGNYMSCFEVFIKTWQTAANKKGWTTKWSYKDSFFTFEPRNPKSLVSTYGS